MHLYFTSGMWIFVKTFIHTFPWELFFMILFPSIDKAKKLFCVSVLSFSYTVENGVFSTIEKWLFKNFSALKSIP
jgi:hypothetical protein